MCQYIWGRKPAFLFSIIFGLLPIIAFALIYLSSSVIGSKRRSELQAQQQKQVAEIKSRLSIKEPAYIPDYLIKTRDVPKDDGITFEYQWREILSEYPICFTIEGSCSKPPIMPEDELLKIVRSIIK